MVTVVVEGGAVVVVEVGAVMVEIVVVVGVFVVVVVGSSVVVVVVVFLRQAQKMSFYCMAVSCPYSLTGLEQQKSPRCKDPKPEGNIYQFLSKPEVPKGATSLHLFSSLCLLVASIKQPKQTRVSKAQACLCDLH